MVFSSLPFLLWFLPAVLAAYYLLPRRFRNIVLLLFSLFFYAWGEPIYVLLMLGYIAMDYGLGRWIGAGLAAGDRLRARRVLILAVILNIGLLGFFKYTNFLLSSLNSLFSLSLPPLDLPLPIGISFYTFQALSYLIDLYRGEVELQRNPFDFGMYVTLFPQLIAGPIVRLKTIAGELRDRRETTALFASGVRRFTVGLGKKVLLANTAGALWEEIGAADPAGLPVLTAWIGLAAFTFQIYFDFSGYSDMAVGLGRMFGFRFPENFDHPYLSRSITEFWRRWHISLGTWFREYVYIPLGGNRRGRGRLVLNLLIVWGLTGIWHGASWNFVVWGLFFGVLLILEKRFLLHILERLPRLSSWCYAMLLVMLGWVLFAHDSLSEGMRYLAALFGSGAPISPLSLYYLSTNLFPFLLMALFSTDLPRRLCRRASARVGENTLALVEPLALSALLLLCVACLVDATYNPFLYFRF